MNEKELIKQGYKQIGNCGINFNPSIYDYRSYCCGAIVHAETNHAKMIGFACKECGKGLSGLGVYAKVRINKDPNSLSESRGIVRALKWVKFLSTYKNKDNIEFEIDRFISQEELRHPELKGVERY